MIKNVAQVKRHDAVNVYSIPEKRVNHVFGFNGSVAMGKSFILNDDTAGGMKITGSTDASS